jgi:uncharacterized protein
MSSEPASGERPRLVVAVAGDDVRDRSRRLAFRARVLPPPPDAGRAELSGAAPAGARIAALDGLRGLAVLGILLMNVGGFALPTGAYFNPNAVAVSGPFDQAIWLVQFVLIDGKMRNIFALLFGAGILLFAEREAAAGRDEATIHLHRMAALGVIGLAHYYLLWWGDILFQYAVTGTLAFILVGRSPRVLVAAAVACLAVHMLIAAEFLSLLGALRLEALADPLAALDWRAASAQFGAIDPDAIGREIARLRRGYASLVSWRATVETTAPLTMLLAYGFETLAMMLLGMAALKSGFLSGVWPRRRYRRVALGGYIIGPAPDDCAGLEPGARQFDPAAAVAVATLWTVPLRSILAIAHVAVAILWLRAGSGWLRAASRQRPAVALSNYLGTSLS